MVPKILSEIYEFDKNSAEKVRLRFVEYQRGNRFLDVRVYCVISTNDTPNWLATKKGFSINLDLVDELKKGIDKAAAKIEEGL